MNVKRMYEFSVFIIKFEINIWKSGYLVSRAMFIMEDLTSLSLIGGFKNLLSIYVSEQTIECQIAGSE